MLQLSTLWSFCLMLVICIELLTLKQIQNLLLTATTNQQAVTSMFADM